MQKAFPILAYDALKECDQPTQKDKRFTQCKQSFITMQCPNDKLHRMIPSVNKMSGRPGTPSPQTLQ